MRLHNAYSYGQLFCFSGLDGETSRTDDFVGMMMHEPISIRFHFENTVTLKLPINANPEFECVLGDLLVAKNLIVAFNSHKTIVGKSPVRPLILTEIECERNICDKTEEIITDFGRFYLTVVEKYGIYYFNLSYGVKNFDILFDEELEQIKAERYAYFEKMPKCKIQKYERLYNKCLSINKENVYSPEGNINCRWTTPDRVPHRFMWLWDSVFHAISFAEYNMDMAKDCIRSILCMQDEDGFIAHMYNPYGKISEITQPQVLAWGTWHLFKKDGDREFLKECAPKIQKFLDWTIKNRDKDNNGLLEWFTEPDYTECKCGESGLDNSPRFDFDVDMDAIDFSTYLCNDSKYLSYIFEELGDSKNAKHYLGVHESVKNKINQLLWCEEDGLYYDRLFNGKLTRVSSFASFLPMFAGICSKEQAEKMVKVLLDENKFWTQTPIPSMPKDSEFYDIDMWRGCSWLNVNYLIILGLKKYGYEEIAIELRQRTLEAVYKWYIKTGNIFEFYDADDNVCPFNLKRKGEQPEIPDYREHVHAISDYNWSACFTHLLIQSVIID